ncbi:unnamed protein product [Caenorhabditis angaria]|uniref:Solute carrier organic anion transporter family member n=1 Tax=Caenorhabditis angaria TaxID=860376 RepID=A0A9P1IZM1_9PELO|nr:unnamed protein product [Caenorhabditis angaria]
MQKNQKPKVQARFELLPDRQMGEKTEEETSFGNRFFRPKRLQWLANFAPFMVILCANGFLQGAVVNGLVSTSISSIEKRFKLSSQQSGLFAATYDVFVTVMLLPLAIYSMKINKVKAIGYGMLFVAVGSLLTVLPEFLAGPYEAGALRSTMCSKTGANDTVCVDEIKHTNVIAQYFQINPSYMFLLLSQALIGIGASPLFTYGFTCVDEFDAHERTGKNMAYYMSATTIGPAVAFIGGGAALSLWGDFARTNPEDLGIQHSEDPRWIGAWWVGFLICGVLSLFSAIPLTMFPRKLKDTTLRKKHDVHQTDVSLNKDFSNENNEFLKIFWMLLKNPTVICIIWMQTAESMLMNGYITFIPKLLETLFGYSSGMSSAITGALVVPIGVFGSLVGGYISKHFKNRFRPSMYSVIGFTILAALFSGCLLIKCEQIDLVGVNYDNQKLTEFGVSGQCNTDCHCNHAFNPVCATDSKLSFLSPCHAGCSDSPSVKIGATNWTSCACSSNKNGLLQKGFCPVGCFWEKCIFFVLFSIMAFCIFVTAPIMQSASVRVVHFKHRDHFMCFGWLWMRICGSIPGALLFGYIIDSKCLFWQKDCDGSKCQYYDAEELGFSFFIFTVVVKAICVVLLLIAAKSYNEQDHPEEDSNKSSARSAESVSMSFRKKIATDMPSSTVVY